MSKKMCLCEIQEKYFPKMEVFMLNADEQRLIEDYRKSKGYSNIRLKDIQTFPTR